MKRYFIIFLSLVVVLASFPVAVSAETFDPTEQVFTSYYDLDDVAKRYFNTTSNSLTFSFNLGDYSSYISYSEFFIYSSKEVQSATVNGNAATVVRKGNFYRIYSGRNVLTKVVDINLSFVTSNAWIYVMSADFSTNLASTYDISASFSISSDGVTNQYSYSSGSVSYSLSAVNHFGSYNFETDFVLSDIELFDYLTLSLYFYCISISSISVGYNDTYNIPFSVSYLDSFDMEIESSALSTSNQVNAPYNLKLDIDLRNIDFSNVSSLAIQINGNVYRNSVDRSLLHINGIHGFIIADVDDPIIFWFRKTYTGLGSWFNTLFDQIQDIFTGRSQDQTAADTFNDSIDDQSNELEDLTSDLNSVTRPPLSDVNLSTGTMVDSSSIVLVTSGLGSIMSNTIILRVLLMALTFALAGFILFGKR